MIRARDPVPAPAAAPRFEVIDGRVALVMPPRPSVLPAQLDSLLRELGNVTRNQVIVTGTASDCGDGRHRLALWLTGLYRGRELRLELCRDCETIEVRDVSVDLLPGAPLGRRAPRRRNALLGWYTGKRPAGRLYL